MLDKLYDKYKLTAIDKEYLINIIIPIINNPNFKERLTNKYLHHSDITLGEHIIEDAIVTYLLSNKYLNKHKNTNYRIDLAVKIAMLHDLYTIPWQNNKEASVNHFFSKHGFRHPIEAVINSFNWYPEIFNENDKDIIIDGIIHHMYPLPVRILNDKKIDKIELKNIDNYYKLNNIDKELLINSSKRKRIGVISLSKSKYMEGRIMSKADKKVSIRQIKNLSSAKALLTGKNKTIK